MKFRSTKGKYIAIYLPGHPKATSSGYVYEHVKIAEMALGHHLPAKAVIHHFDGNVKNNKNSNLIICEDMAYHELLHCRQRVLKLGGDPNTDKICCMCQEIKPKSLFGNCLARFDNLYEYCYLCVKIKNAEKYKSRAIGRPISSW